MTGDDDTGEALPAEPKTRTCAFWGVLVTSMLRCYQRVITGEREVVDVTLLSSSMDR